MDKIRGLVFAYNSEKRFEPPVAFVLSVMDPIGCRMGDYDIYTAAFPQCGFQGMYDSFHFEFGILVWPAVIPPGAVEPEYSKILKFDDSMMDMDTAAGVLGDISDIMIAPDIIEGSIEKVRELRKIFVLQVAAGENQIRPFVGGSKYLPLLHKDGIIRDRKNPHYPIVSLISLLPPS